MNVSGTMIQDCGEMLRNARKEARVSQTELAERIQTTKSYISRIENGVIIPSVAVFYRMIAALGMSVEIVRPNGYGHGYMPQTRCLSESGLNPYGDKNTNQNRGNILMYQTVDGKTAIEVVLSNETVWLTTEKMAELFQRNKSTISRHIKNILECGELSADSTVAFFATVQKEGNRNIEREIVYYNLDMIISVGYRVNSIRGIQFRHWATSVLREYLIKGFAMNDELLKNAGGGNYFDELLSRIRDIRSSEKIFYRKVLEIYALSIDYDPRSEATKQFFATVQNKMHYSAHGHTAAEVIYERADSEKDFMGLTAWTGALPTRTDAEYAKNYLSAEEMETLNLIVNLYLDFAELQAKSHTPMYMNDWLSKLDDFLKLSGKDLLMHSGKISAEVAKKKANEEYTKFHQRSMYELSPVELHFIENFEKEHKSLKKIK